MGKISIFTVLTLCSLVYTMNMSVVSADEYYVATWGNNSNQGTLCTPWQNISYAAQQLKAGDTLYLIDGIWYNESMQLKKSGISDLPIYITAYNGTPTLIGNNKGNAISIVAYPTSMKHITISNLKIENYDCGIYAEASAGDYELSQITIENNEISNINNNSIFIRRIGTSDYKINNITVNNNCLSNFGESGIYMLSVRDSKIINNNIRDAMSSVGLVGIGYSICNSTIQGNNLENISTSYGISGAAYTQNNVIQNNTIKNITGRGIRFDYHSKMNKIINNEVSNTKDTGIDLYPDTKSILENNTVENCSLFIIGVNDTIIRKNTLKNCSVNIAGTTNTRSKVIFEENILTDSKNYFSVSYSNDSIFRKNTFQNISAYSAFMFYTGRTSPCYNISLENNTFKNINGKAIYIGWSPVDNLTIIHNSFINVTGYCIDNDYGTDVIVSYNNVWSSKSPCFDSINDTNTTYKDPSFEEVSDKTINTTISLSPSSNRIIPNEEFRIDVLIDPSTPIIGTQLDILYQGSMANINKVSESDFFRQSGACTIFSSGAVNNSAGIVKDIYGFILGTSNVSSPGTMATVNLTAGNRTGIAKFSLSNVLISNANSKSVPYTITNATVLIDTAPVIASIEPKSVYENNILTFKVSAKDADGDRLILSASGIPKGAIFNTTSGNFTWTPSVGQAGVYTFTFKVSDGYLSDSENVTVTVNKNNAPVISSFEPLNGSSFSEGERIRILVNASDANGQALNYSIRINGVVYTTNKEYVWETDYSSSGNHTIEVVVSDGIGEVKQHHIIYITNCHPRWDVDGNGIVNILDITSVSQKYGTTVSKPYPRYDVNQDGVINILDLTLVGNHFGEYVT